MTYQIPVPLTSPKDPQSFAFASVSRRWPTILTGIIDSVYQANANDKAASEDKLEDGKLIIQSLAGLRHEMGRDYKLTELKDDGGANIEIYNNELKKLQKVEDDTWFKAPWLFAECYMYRRIRTYFAESKYFKNFDPFKKQKDDTFKSSKVSVIQLAKAQENLIKKHNQGSNEIKIEESLEIMFLEMLQMSLWGNATDLSLLVDLDYEDVQKLQSVGKKALDESSKKIIKNDLNKVWNYIKGIKDGRIDIVLDNAGYELYTDLILAEFLIECTPFASKVVFHPKTIPWFVSDVLQTDMPELLNQLSDENFFGERNEEVLNLSNRWKSYFNNGKFELSVPSTQNLGVESNEGKADFWVTPYPYCFLPEISPRLLHDLKQSSLVIFKGDLNYRKLTSDALWDSTTPFKTALGPLASQFPLLSLRTNKADVIVGLDHGIPQQLESQGDLDWRVSGKYAVVSFDN